LQFLPELKAKSKTVGHVQHQIHKSMDLNAHGKSAGAAEFDLLSLRRRRRAGIQ
jgi:hypothetical protein